MHQTSPGAGAPAEGTRRRGHFPPLEIKMSSIGISAMLRVGSPYAFFREKLGIRKQK